MANQKILLADDSLTIQKVINLTFADEGIDVLTYGNGDDAFAELAAQMPDIVLADVNMPGLNGYQICEKMRGSLEMASIPVILLVGSFEPFDEAEASRVGANAFLTKPFHSIRQLVDLVNELLSGKNTETAEPIVQPPAVAGADPEQDDIDRLYEDSFSSADTLPDMIDTSSEDLTDVGMDDEMIETSYAGDPEEPADIGSEMATVPDSEDIYREDETVIRHDFESRLDNDSDQDIAKFIAEHERPSEVSAVEEPEGHSDYRSENWANENREEADSGEAYTISEESMADISVGPWQPLGQQPEEQVVFEPALEPSSEEIAQNDTAGSTDPDYGFEIVQHNVEEEDIHSRDTQELPATQELPVVDVDFETVETEYPESQEPEDLEPEDQEEEIASVGFQTVNSELPSYHDEDQSETSVSYRTHEGEEPPVKKYDDEDLLEIPAVADPVSAAHNSGMIKEISPELLDLIVEKVLERLAER